MAKTIDIMKQMSEIMSMVEPVKVGIVYLLIYVLEPVPMGKTNVGGVPDFILSHFLSICNRICEIFLAIMTLFYSDALSRDTCMG